VKKKDSNSKINGNNAVAKPQTRRGFKKVHLIKMDFFYFKMERIKVKKFFDRHIR
jgi:hypothetical protein